MSLRGKLTEEAPTERQFDEVSELDKELERTEILREQLIRKKELAKNGSWKLKLRRKELKSMAVKKMFMLLRKYWMDN